MATVGRSASLARTIRLGIDRSELLREALRRFLVRLRAEDESEAWRTSPLTEDEEAVAKIAEWVPPKTGLIGSMQRGEVWLAATPGGDRPVLVLTRDPVADRVGSVVVAALTRMKRGVVSELDLNPEADGVPTSCVANFDNLHTLHEVPSDGGSLSWGRLVCGKLVRFSETQPAVRANLSTLRAGRAGEWSQGLSYLSDVGPYRKSKRAKCRMIPPSEGRGRGAVLARNAPSPCPIRYEQGPVVSFAPRVQLSSPN